MDDHLNPALPGDFDQQLPPPVESSTFTKMQAFFEQYADRVLFGKDSYRAEEFPYYWRTFETEDEYFDYYRRYHAFWKLYGLGLSDDVLRKVYYENALRVVPGIPRNGFPPLH